MPVNFISEFDESIILDLKHSLQQKAVML